MNITAGEAMKLTFEALSEADADIARISKTLFHSDKDLVNYREKLFEEKLKAKLEEYEKKAGASDGTT